MSDYAKRIVEKIRKEFGADSALRLGEDQAKSEVREVIPTGIEVLDRYVLGIGGLPVGRLVELYSEEGTGKTSFAMGCAASAQREGGVVVWCETEEAISTERMKTFGVDVDDLVVLQPGSIEEAGQQVETALKVLPAGKAGANLVVWDSIAATPTKAEAEGGLADYSQRMGERARSLGAITRLLKDLLPERHATLLAVNQVREKIGVMFGDKYTTPGGHAVKFAASVRLQLFGGKAVKEGDQHVGKIITFMAAKNRMAPPWRKAQVKLDYAAGWENLWSTVNHAKDVGKLPEGVHTTEKAYADAKEALGWV